MEVVIIGYMHTNPPSSPSREFVITFEKVIAIDPSMLKNYNLQLRVELQAMENAFKHATQVISIARHAYLLVLIDLYPMA